MNETTDPVVIVPSNYEWTRHWQQVADVLPNHNGPVFGYCPDIREDGDNQGMVLVVRCVHDSFARDVELVWVDSHGLPVRVTHWADLLCPEPPAGAKDGMRAGEQIWAGEVLYQGRDGLLYHADRW